MDKDARAAKPHHIEESFIGVHGTRIVYDVWTPTVPIRGVLVLSHGLGEHAGRYHHVIARLLGLGLVVYAIDHRGHGRSGGTRLGLKKWSDFTDDLGALLRLAKQQHPGTETFLLGHSMGSAIALSYALDHQDELDALMLSGPAVVPGYGQPKLLLAVGDLLGKIAPWAPVLTLDSGAVSRDPAVVDAYRADPLVHHGKVTAGIASSLVREAATFPARLPGLTVPLLVQHGSADALADVSGARMIADRVGSADFTLKIYDGLFHEVFNEPERDEVLGDLIAWLGPRLEVATTEAGGE